jgi:hypothetical protein
MWLEGQDKVVVVVWHYHNTGKLVGAQVAGKDHVCRTECSAFLVKDALRQLGWMQLEEHSSTRRLPSGHITFSTFAYPGFLGRLLSPLKGDAGSKVRARQHSC